MRRAFPAHINEGPSANVYFEFNFFDGVMVDCKEVNTAEWGGPLQAHLNPSPKVGDSAGATDNNDRKNLSTGRELRESNAPNMESRHDWKKEKQASLKGGGKCSSESSNAGTAMHSSNVGNGSADVNKDPANKKRVQFLNGENHLAWNPQSATSLNDPEHCAVSRISCGSSVAVENSYRLGHCGSEPNLFSKVHGQGIQSSTSGHKYTFGDYASRGPVSLSTGHLDWLWSEEAERQETLAAMHQERSTLAVASSGPNGGARSSDFVEKENGHYLPLRIGEDPCSHDGSLSMVSGRHSWKAFGNDPAKLASGGWAAFSIGDSARCSSMSLTDLVETSPGKCPRDVVWRERSTLASHLQLAGSSLANQFCTKEADMDCLWPFSPVHSSLSTGSASKRDSAGTKVESKYLSVSDPIPSGNLHGILHCALRAGLPNYTFLLDDYDEVVTAKIWMEDVVLGEQHGVWRYTFYSLKGDSKKKGRSGWKHWRKKEKLVSELVGTMKVSSVLCSEPGLNGDENVSVESEFVLLSARAQDPSLHTHADLLSQTSSSSLETGLHGCSKVANHMVINTSSSPCQSRASSSDGAHSDTSSPGAISAWYVSQSLIPSSLGSSDLATDGRQKSRKWSLHSGISGMRISKAKRRGQQSTNVNVPSYNLNTEDPPMEPTCSFHQSHTELAAMIINVPLELQDGFTGSIPAAMSDADYHGESPIQEHGAGWYQNGVPEAVAAQREVHAAADHVHYTKHKVHHPHRQASITVILPSGNHGRPLSDTRGPSPLIKRWKEGGKCDCKGWDLGCGLLVLNNEQPMMEGSESSLTRTREVQAHNKPLTLYRQDSDQDEAYLSLAPQENGLIAVDFRAPLSPLQAFAMAVALLHGRGSGVPDSDASHMVMTTAARNLETQSSPSEKKGGCQVAEQDAGVTSSPGYMAKHAGKRTDRCIQSPRQTCHVHDGLDVMYAKAPGNEVFGCTSELALSFERV